MGDLEALSIQPDGFLIEDGLFSPTSISPLLSNPSPESISGECWEQAEETTKEIIKQIQPTVVSEQRRKAVIEYLQCLIKSSLSGEVYPFGSVPLKTYLPDGDIDLTALSVQQAEDTLANGVRVVLEREEQRNDADFEVKDVQYINAEVKLIKCLVQNIVVDISFNQLGGLCTLCFLEQVDRLIGKNHLFKRSIILIKAWCYYESRILGAHHGLISTYALETMVLYIFHLFHSSLDGPLAVLYRFLEYYSKFDWDNFCISLNGPVSISSLPEIVAETPDNDGGELLLDKEFLGNCIEQFSVPSRGLDADSRSFPQKHFNIVDPLKENNNLGRSVSKGNFYRIRSAFTYGARKLGQILLLTAEDIADELNKFFTNTLDRHGSGQRPDVQVSVPTSNASLSDPAPSKSVEKCTGTRTVLNSPSVSSSGTAGDSRSCPEELLQEGTSNINLSGSHRKSSTGLGKEPQRCTTGMGSSLEVLERFGYIKEIGISGGRLVGDAEDRTSSRMPGPLVTISSSECIPHSCEPVTSPIGGAHHAPHLYLSPPHRENGNIENQMLSKLSQGTAGEMDTVVQKDSEASKLGTDHEKDSCEEGSVTVVKIDGPSVSSLLDPVDASASTTGSVGTPNSLSDLSGDYYSHLNSLLCAQWCHGFPISGQYLPMPVPSPFQSNHAFDTLHRPMQLMPNVFPHVNANAVFPRTHLYPMHATISGSAFGVEDPSQATKRGIGTYFPNMFQGERIPSGRTVPPVPHDQFGRPYRGSSYFGEKGSHVPPQEQYSSLHIRPKPVVPPGFYQDNHPMSRGSSHPNGFTLPTEKVEFGSFGQMASGAPSPEVSKQPVYGTHSQGNSSHLSTVTTPRPRPVSGVNVEGYLP